jgi:nucleotide-binding universal stress UspA family protein
VNALSGPVVCGVGGRHSRHQVAGFAAGLARALDAPLALVRAEAAARLGGSRSALQHGHVRVRLGDPATVLAAVAEELEAQLLVVGAGHVATPLGALQRELAMRAVCPVLVLPRGATPAQADGWQHRLVLCAFDESVDARATLGVAAGFADRVGAAAFIAHIRPGSLHELTVRAHAEQAALIVAPSHILEDRHSTRAGSAPNGPAATMRTPLLVVPPAYRPGAAAPVGAAAV